jgi:transcriptional regulator of acetoin/glycerol metabolism
LTKIQPLVIVRRDKFATFGLLAQAFANEPHVRLVWDRRVRERRNDRPSSGPADRRRRDRRRTPSTAWGAHDYMLVNITESVAPDTAQADNFAPADADRRARDSEEIRLDVEAAVQSNLTVLISGSEAALRKSVADRIHRRSALHDRPLIVVGRDAFFDVSAPGMDSPHAAPTEWTNAGTILIEEVADLSWDQQSQLSRILESRAVQGWDHRANLSLDARIISGTSHQLLERVASRQFRADLFYRLNVIHIVLPLDWVPAPD